MDPQEDSDVPVGTAGETHAERKFQFLLATVAVLGSLVGAVVGVFGASGVAEKQIAAQREDDRAQFLRTERRAAYGKVVALDGQLSLGESELTIVEADGPLAALKEIKAETKELWAMLDRLQTANSTVVLIGSASLANAGDHLWFAHQRYVASLSGLVSLERTDLEASQLKELRKETAAARDGLYEARGDFLARARLELAGGVDPDSLDLDNPDK